MMVETSHDNTHVASWREWVSQTYAQHGSIVFNRKEGADLDTYGYVGTDFDTGGKIRNQTKNMENKVI